MYQIKRGNTVIWSGKAQGKQSKVIMQEDRVEITIKSPIPIVFKKGDTIIVYGETYKLNRPENIGKTNTEIGYTYTIEFEALYYDLGKWILNTLDKNNNLTEPDVYIMGEASVILGLLVQNANRAGSGWTLGQVDRTETIQWAYNGAKLLTVLQDVADQTNLEFWCVGKQINLTRKQIQTGITFQYGKGKGLYELRRDRKDNPVVTHMKVQGGTQNIPNGYGFRQIQPTGGNPMVNPNYVAGMEVVEDVLTFENVYPRLEAKVTSVQANNIIRSNDIDFNLNDYLLNDGSSAQIAFTSGLLNSFKFTISEDGFDNATKQVKFNPITDENAYPDGVPNAMLKPAVGDSFVFLNINMPQSYVTAAENRVKELGDQYFEEEGTEQYTWSGKITPKFILENNIELTLGGIVNLNASDIGFSGPIRIASYTRDLEEEYLYDFTLSNVVTINYLVRLRNQSDRLANAVSKGLSSDGLSNKSTYAESAGFATLAGHANTATNAATSNFANQAQNAANADRAIIANRSNFSDQADHAALSDRAINADHADKATLADRATLANYALDADHAKEADHSKLADRASIADYAYDSDKWDGKHFADYLDQPVRINDDVRHQSISTPAFVSGATGSGWKLFADGSAEVDSLTVRKSLNVVQLVVREITGTGGSFAITNVAKIARVYEREDHYSCHINTDGDTLFVPFNAGDIVRCQVWDGKGIKYYVGRVQAVSQGIFDIAKPLLAGSGVPSAGDNVFQFGSSVIGRQGLIYMTNSDTGAPYLDVLDGIDSPSLEGKTKVRLGKLNGITDSVFGALSGYGLYAQNAYLRGAFWVTGGNAETQQGAQSKAAAAYNDAVVVAGQDATAKANAAKDFAAAQDNLAKVETKAYADGIVDAEEARAIADAQAKLSEAKNHADAQAAQAQANAIASASQDATAKANAVKNEAISSANQFTQNAVDAIKVGGRNLVLNTGNKIDVSNPTAAYHLSTYYFSTRLENLSTYLISFKVKTFVGKTAQIWFRTNKDQSSSYDQTIDFNPEKIEQIKTYSGLFTATQNDENIVFYNYGYGSTNEQRLNNTFILYDLKIEKGNKATDWTPAPEDIADALDVFKTETSQSFAIMDGKIEGKVSQTDFNSLGQTVNQQGTLISQNASSIESKATKQEFSELSNTVGGLTGRIATAETSIQQNSTDISLRAVKTEVDSQINNVNGRIDNTVSRLSAAELKITPEAINLTVKGQTETIVNNAVKVAVPVTKRQISTIGLDVNKYYPVNIRLDVDNRYKIIIDRPLTSDYGMPSYGQHSTAGFSAHIEWYTNGSGWGSKFIDREIIASQQRFANGLVLGSLGQVTELSEEIIFLRGGSLWDVIIEGVADGYVNVNSNGYHWQAGEYSGSIPVLDNVSEIKSTVNRLIEAETSITQTKDEILLRATKTEVITQVNQVRTDASTDASAKANNAQNNAISAASSDASTKANNAQNNAISTAKVYTDSQITVTNNAISLKADKTVVEGIDSRLSSAELKITPDAINSTVSGQIDNKISDVVVIKDTREFNNPPSWYYDNYPRRTVQEFKRVTVLGLPYVGEDFAKLTTNVPWLDFSGGNVVQDAIQAGRTYTRYGGGDSWTAWIERESTNGAQDKANAAQAQAYYDAVGYTNSQISQTKNEINLSVESRINDVNNEIGGLKNRVNQAELKITDDSIRAVVRQQTENIVNDTVLANMWASGKPLNPDPTFKEGFNGLKVYNNAGTGATSWNRMPVSDFNEIFPTTSGYGVYFRQDGDRVTSPNWGGFYFETQSRAKAKFLTRLVLAFEEGRNINFHSNAIGDNATVRWLTPTAGKGINNFVEYIAYVECGDSGPFSTTNFFAFSGGNSVSVRIAFAGVYDITDAINNYTTKQEIASSFEMTPGGISLAGKTISLVGMVTFSSLDADSQGRVNTANDKASNAQSIANTAKGTANSALSTAQGANGTAETALSTANGAKNTADSANGIATAASTKADNANTTALNASDVATAASTKADNANTTALNASDVATAASTKSDATSQSLAQLQNSLKSLAYEDKVEAAKLGTTIVNGGFLKTELINVNELFAKNITATGQITATNLLVTGNSKVAGFDISGNALVNASGDASIKIGDNDDYVNLNASSSLLSVGTFNANKTGVNIQTYAAGSVGLRIVNNVSGGGAIRSYGSHEFYPRPGEFWSAPGVLGAWVIRTKTGILSGWEIKPLQNIDVSFANPNTNVTTTITHNLGHTNYIVLLNGVAHTITNITANSFQYNGGTAGLDNTIVMIGMNKII
ncbi:carbohydrate binding domain-containing protein [Sphingobacterium multivorum]|uniref:alanine-zipper protein n=1 Tax=Sphingobacterium multivorum TaxID=28454 RepID=UPI00191AE33F|nr:alanine-zipper protein [Sphingobacterium multivorum]QQT60993.1 carbohydrate binding domain-containing protein [Sphingobacterium multivorum]